jgi:DNA-binding winged helix-turn-helix (wHTH) protein/Tol biopolymer transport system component
MRIGLILQIIAVALEWILVDQTNHSCAIPISPMSFVSLQSLPPHLELSDPSWQELLLSIEPIKVDIGALRLQHSADAPAQKLTQKAMQVLLALASRPEQTIARDQLMDLVWKETCPTPDVLTQAIKELRKALQDDQKAPRFIETIPKIGYRWIASAEFQLKSRRTGDTTDKSRRTGDTTDEPSSSMPKLDVSSNATDAPQTIAVALTSKLAAAPPRINKRSFWMLGTVLLSLLIVLIIWLRPAPQRALGPSESVQASFRLLTSDPGIERDPTISRNGKILGFVRASHVSSDANRRFRIWVRDLASPNAVALNPTIESEAPVQELMPQLSADGSEIIYIRFIGDAHQGPIDGIPFEGAGECAFVTQRVLAGTAKPRMACPKGMVLPFSWPATDVVLVSIQSPSNTQSAQESVGIYRLDLNSGQRQRLASTAEQAVFDWFPKISPDGRWLAFRRGGNVDSILMLAKADGSSPRVFASLGFSAFGFDWVADSSSVVASLSDDTDDHLVRLMRDGKRQVLGVTGRFPSVANTHQVVMAQVDREDGLFSYDLTTLEPAKRIFSSTSMDSLPAISPDGKYLLFQSKRGGIDQLWLAASDDAQPRPITQTPGRFSNIHWAADSRSFWFAQHAVAQPQSSVYRFELASERAVPLALTDLGLVLRISEAQNQLYLLATRSGKRMLSRIALNQAGLANGKPILLMEDIGSFQIDAQTGRIFLTRIGNNTLFERMPDQSLRPVIESFEPQFIWYWRAHAGKIYFHQSRDSGMTLVAFDVNTQETIPVRSLPAADLSIDWRNQRAIVPQTVDIEINIASVMLTP